MRVLSETRTYWSVPWPDPSAAHPHLELLPIRTPNVGLFCQKSQLMAWWLLQQQPIRSMVENLNIFRARLGKSSSFLPWDWSLTSFSAVALHEPVPWFQLGSCVWQCNHPLRWPSLRALQLSWGLVNVSSTLLPQIEPNWTLPCSSQTATPSLTNPQSYQWSGMGDLRIGW
jgi:hypothetical protein